MVAPSDTDSCGGAPLDGADRVVLHAPAKINMTLEVLGQRASGYHDIRSVVMPVALFDDIWLERTAGVVETVVASESGVGGGSLQQLGSGLNLATRAAQALKEASGYAGGARITLEKRIPLGGGLGGGSTNAAAVLVGLNRLWSTGFTQARLMEIGAGIGCDVPALIPRRAVCMEGLGDRVSPVENVTTTPWWIVLANPSVHVSTADIYARWRKSSLTCAAPYFRNMVCALQTGDVHLAANNLVNGLQSVVFRKFPLIEMVCEAMMDAGCLGALLCGSGASVFGLAATQAQAEATRARLRAAFGVDFWVQVTKTLPDGVMVAHGPLEA
jgi:4-diphosphocytidyl-2-C-methyl-D-erythritol kinase